MVRDGKPKGFFILITVLLMVSATSSRMYMLRLAMCMTLLLIWLGWIYIERFNFDVEAVGLDAGYYTAAICKGLEDRDIFGAISYRRPNHKKGYFYKREYEYDAESDEYICPAGEDFLYSTTSREGYRLYTSDSSVCVNCEHLNKCTKDAKYVKTVTRHIWQDYKERSIEKRLSPSG